eukprot:Em0007g69a
MKPDFGIFLAERKVVQFFADKVVLFLSLLNLSFIVIDSFIRLLPYGNGTVQCFIESNSVASGQQSYIDAYCAEYVPRGTYLVPISIFIHGLTTVLLHYAWYSTVLYANRFVKATGKDAEVRSDANASVQRMVREQTAINGGSAADIKEVGAALPEEERSGTNPSVVVESVQHTVMEQTAFNGGSAADIKEVGAALPEEERSGTNASVVVESVQHTVMEQRAPSSRGRPICLLICYGIKNFLQAGVAVVAVTLSFDYEFDKSSKLSISINKTFLCPIKGQGNIDYWTDLDTVQCFYSSIALNDVFLIFYGIMSICVFLAASFGLVDICVRPDLNRCCIRQSCSCCCKSCSSSCSCTCLKFCYTYLKSRCSCTCLKSCCTCLKSCCSCSESDSCCQPCSCCCSCELAKNDDILEYCLDKVPITKEHTINIPA